MGKSGERGSGISVPAARHDDDDDNDDVPEFCLEFAGFSLFLESHSVFRNCFLTFFSHSIEQIPSVLLVLFWYEEVI